MTRAKITLLFSLTAVLCAKDAKPLVVTEKHFRVYKGDGTASTLDELVARSRTSTVTLLGELHDDPVAHYLEAEILKRTWDADLALSLEFFERDVQSVLDEYLAGLITENHLKSSGRAWNNYATDYRPLIEFAKEKKMAVIAANAPGRYVNRVGRLGAASLLELSAEARRSLPPLPYAGASSEYAAKFAKEMNDHRGKNPAPSPDAAARSLEAQSLWDASMAFSIANFLTGHPGKRVVHVSGSFHVAERLGTVDHLLRYRPNTTALVVVMTSEKSFPEFNSKTMMGHGDFVIVTDPKLPRSYTSKKR